MNLSIITGTYNRLSYLKDMISSVRHSTPRGITYEIVVVDGGSTDGTIGYLKNQPDVVLIKHGELKGAIKAFNDAAEATKGDYIIPANDDIVFLDNTIGLLLAHIMENPLCGAGCCYQDRNNQTWHVEHMQVKFADGSATLVPYVQVGIIPRWLWFETLDGKHKPGWGDFGSNTYGGDNYISAKIMEAGYKIEPVEGARIHDATPIDELRKHNNEINMGGKDGQKFYAAFPDGVRYNTEPQVPNPLGVYKKVLYAPIYEPGHRIQQEQKMGLRIALQKLGAVWEVDYYGGRESIGHTAEIWKPNYVVTQIHNADEAKVKQIQQVRRHTKDWMVNWCGDVWSEQQKTPEYLEMLRSFDLQTGVNQSLKKTYDRYSIPYAYWQIGFEPLIRGKEACSPMCDVIFVANGYSEKRRRLAHFLKKLPHDVKIFGASYEAGVSDGVTLYDFRSTGALLRGSRIIIGDNQFPDDEGFVSNRLFDSLAAGGGMLLHQEVKGMEKLIGFKDGVHYVSWKDEKDLKAKIKYYLEHGEERDRIAEAGHRECLANHSFPKRVEKINEIVSALPKQAYKISACMICKNEIKNLNVLNQVNKFVEEIVVVDTGSRDGTRERLEELAKENKKIKLYDFEWKDDFSAARNFAKQKAKGGWIFWADFDDFIPERTIQSLQKFEHWTYFEKHGRSFPQAFKMVCRDASTTQQIMQTRLFRNLPDVEWQSPVHETVDMSLVSLGICPDALYKTEIIHRSQVTKQEVLRKQFRNIKILSTLRDGVWKYYQIAASNIAIGQWAEAIICYQIILDRLKCEDEGLNGYIWFAMGYAYMRLNLEIEARKCFERSNFIDAYFMLASLRGFGDSPELLQKFLEARPPDDLPTFSENWKAEAREHLLTWHKNRIGELQV